MTFPNAAPELMIYAGDTFAQQFIFLDATTGEPIDLDEAGWDNWEAQYRESRYDRDHVAFSVDASAADEGAITISLTAEETATIHERGVWDLQATNGTTVRTFVTSFVYVEKDVTRA
jgi:hypothetical protein